MELYDTDTITKRSDKENRDARTEVAEPRDEHLKQRLKEK